MTNHALQPTACSVQGCGRQTSTSGLCSAHYQRQWKHGDTGTAAVAARRPTTCATDGCDEPRHALGYCASHHSQAINRSLSDLEPDHAAAAAARELNPQWVGTAVTYQGAHSRLERERGRPLAHRCTGCGRPAAHWVLAGPPTASTRTDPTTGWTYSADPDDYVPTCLPCRRVLQQQAVAAQDTLPGLEVLDD